ncbi:hypothetical protein BVG16_12530 [Paenibacillus selenitireducens]|uniref:Uncharacterized protein n=1 Tax=Paenibacillus selenitireducens TaxID=1324314 RepID=A0A1T2XFT9_9BACL|nr:hypothetical protein [Paenibacillus selenitireducens]OPA78682.1 hypothetical protein BVG16_12530 [Paenibacillus selenitireducens]
MGFFGNYAGGIVGAFVAYLIAKSQTADTDKPAPLNNQSLKIIIFQGLNYKVTNEEINDQDIEQKVGEVKSYSNKSGEHYVVDAFSNAYQVGTELYKIKDKDVSEAIVVKN